MEGLLVEVIEDTRGSQAAATAPMGATELAVEDLTDFPEDGGIIDVLGVRYDYTEVTPDAPVMDEFGDLSGGGVLTLAEPLAAQVDEDDPVLLVVGTEPASEALAVVDIDTGDSTDAPEGGDLLRVPLTYDQRALFIVGPYDPPIPVTVADDLSAILDVPGVRPTVSGSFIDPTTLPEPVPVEPPEESPEISVVGMPTALLVKTFDTVAPTTVLRYHVSATQGFTPDASTLSAETRSGVYILNALPDGSALVPESTYYVRVVAANAAGEAAPSLDMPGTLNPDALIELAVARIIAGFVLAGTIQVGQITIDADDGIRIPSGTGYVKFPVDGSVSTITAALVATALTMEGTAVVQELMRIVGRIELQDAGVADPDAAPSLGAVFAEDMALATEPLVNGGNGLGLAISESGTEYVAQAYSNKVRAYSIADGSVVGETTLAGGAGDSGLARIGSNYFTANLWIVSRVERYLSVVKHTTAGAFVTEFKQTDVPLGTGYTPRCVGNDGANLLLAWRVGNTVKVRTLNPANGAVISTSTYTMPAGSTGLVGVARGTFHYGATRTVIVPASGNASVFNGTAEVSANRWSAGVEVGGVVWDGSRFVSLIDGSANLKVRRHAPAPASRTVTAAHTWYDADPIGGTHETRPSKVATATIPAGRHVSIECSPPPPNPPNPDVPTRVRVYAAESTGTRVLQATLAEGVRTMSAGALTTGTAPAPTTNTFAGVEGFAPGLLESGARDTDGAKLALRGDGSARLGNLSVTPDGSVSDSTETPYAHGYWGIAASTFSHNTWTPYGSAYKNERVGGMAYSAATGIYTVPQAGLYLITARVLFSPHASGYRGIRLIFENDEPEYGYVTPGPSPSVSTAWVSATVRLAAGDTIAPEVVQTSGVALGLNVGSDGAYNSVSIVRVGS